MTRPVAVLCLSGVLDARLTSGGAVDAASSARSLTELGFDVRLVGFRRRRDADIHRGFDQIAMPVAPRAVSTLRRPRLPLFSAGRDRARGAQAEPVRALLARADLVVAHGDYMLPFAVRHTPITTPLVLRSENDERAYLAARSRGERGPQRWLTAAERHRAPAVLTAAAGRPRTAVALISAADAGAYDEVGWPVVVVPTGLWDPEGAPALPASAPAPVVLFVGSLDQAFNREAVDWFGSQVWPLVRERSPAARWVVAGRRPPAAWARTLPAHVELVADFPDLDALVSTARVLVNPMQHGSGVAMKNAAAFRSARPLVSTRVGARGLEGLRGAGVLVCDDPRQQASQLVRLLDDDEAWRASAADVRLAGSQVTTQAAREGWARVLAALDVRPP